MKLNQSQKTPLEAQAPGRSYNLINGRVYPFNIELAAAIGTNEAILLQQIHNWVEINYTKRDATAVHAGQVWTYGTVDTWHARYFPFWSHRTLERLFARLEGLGLLIAAQPHRKKGDHTKYYRLNYEALDAIELPERLYEGTDEDWGFRHFGGIDSAILAESTLSKEELKKRAGVSHPARDPRTDHPAIQAIRTITKRYPSKDIYDYLIDRLGDQPDVEVLREAWQAWRAADNRPNNWGGIIDWYQSGQRKNGKAAQPAGEVYYDRDGNPVRL